MTDKIKQAQEALDTMYNGHVYGFHQEYQTITRALADAERMREALQALVKLNDEYSPFGGEIYKDRVDATWNKARKCLEEVNK